MPAWDNPSHVFHACSQVPVLSVQVPSHLIELNTGEYAENLVCLDQGTGALMLQAA